MSHLNRDKVEEAIIPIIEDEGMDYWDLQWVIENGRRILRIMIEKDEGVTLDDCALISHAVEDILEVKELIPGKYDLEISSPGIDRPLRLKEHFERFLGEWIKVKTHEPVNNRRNYKGILKGVDGDDIVVEVDKQNYVIPIDKIFSAKICLV